MTTTTLAPNWADSFVSQIRAMQNHIALLTPTPFNAPIKNQTGYIYTLHKQMSNQCYGQVSWQVVGSVEGYVAFLTEARAAGVDAVSLDYGGDGPGNYAPSLKNIYIAANQLNATNGWGPGKVGAVNALGVGKISLHITFDFSSVEMEFAAVLQSVFQRTLPDPANLTISGKPVWCCYAGGGGRSWASLAAIFQPAIAAMKLQGITPFGIWGGEQTNPDGSGCDGSQAALIAWINGCVKPIADAIWQFVGGSPTGKNNSLEGQLHLAQAAKTAGIYFQGAINYGYRSGHNWWNFHGGQLSDVAWRCHLDTIAKLLGPLYLGVQGVTADDIAEQSYILRGYNPATYIPPEGPDFYQPTDGKILDNSYHLHQLKTGVKPIITNDSVAWYYLVMTGDAIAHPTDTTHDIMAGFIDLDGAYYPASQAFPTSYLSCYLEAPAQVRLTSAVVLDATHTHIRTWLDDTCLYDPVKEFTSDEMVIGNEIQFTYGPGFTPGTYKITQLYPNYDTTYDGYHNMVRVEGYPGTDHLYSGQATVYKPSDTIPPLPPAPMVTEKFVSTGKTFIEFPNQAGNLQLLEVFRDNQLVLTLTGHGIASVGSVSNPNYWTGAVQNAGTGTLNTPPTIKTLDGTSVVVGVTS